MLGLLFTLSVFYAIIEFTMSLQQDIKTKMKEAMLAKDPVRVTVLRGLMAAFTNELVAKGKKPQEEIADDDAMSVIKRSVKQRKDSIEQFGKGRRQDLVAGETAELSILETFMPAQMGRDEILKIAEVKKAEMGITDKSKMGIFMGAVMKELKGKADGKDVKEVIESLFS